MTDFDGVVLQVIGSGRAGFRDGDAASAMFFRPQGLVLADANTLYVADTENHVIRRVRLDRDRVLTVAGTGEQVFQSQEEAASLCLIEQVRLILPLTPGTDAPSAVTITHVIEAPG